MFFILIACIQTSAKVNGQKIAIKEKDVSLVKVFNAIKVQTGYTFIYTDGLLQKAKKITLDVRNASLRDVLDICFQEQPLTYTIFDKMVIIREKKTVAPINETPPVDVTGTVVNEKGEPLAGAVITVKGSNHSVITTNNGSFFLNGLGGSETLVVSMIGYKTLEIPVNGRHTISIVLTQATHDLDQIIVVGYGTQKKRDVTGAISSLSAEDLQLNTMPQTTITQSLQGRIPGVTVTTNGAGAEGNSHTIQVRGRNSISAGNSPLIVVDGVPFGDNLSEINPNDIASVDVLKDASSAAIYGSRAANGVILITTKKGTTGKAQIAYNGYFGIDKLGYLPDMMDADEFYQTKVDRFGENILTASEIENHANGVNTDWVKLATRTGQRNQQNLAVSGGSEQIHYYISGTYNGIKGIAKNDDFDRINVRINLEAKIATWLKLGTNTQFGRYGRNGLSASFSNAFTMNPLALPYNPDGTLNLTPWPEDPYWANPLEGLNVIDEDVTHSVFSNNYLQIDFPFIKGLSYRINTGYEYRNRSIEDYYGSDTRAGLQEKGNAVTDNWNYENWLVENIVTYTRRFGEHSIDFTGLYSAQENISKQHNLNANGFPEDIMTYYQNALATVWSPTDSYVKQNYISEMGRLNYSYKNRYLLTATVRRDGYSAFGSDKKYGTFPSIALGWNISEEPFLHAQKWIDMLKLRVSYGKNGNQAISSYATLPQLTEQFYLDNNGETAIGFYPSRLGDPNLGWETTNKLNAGIDYSVVNNRLKGSIDYYYSRTHDLLLNKLISPINGTTSILQNVGEVKNWGMEFMINSVNIQSGSFSWNTDFNISFNRNKIVNVGLTDSSGNPADDISNKWFIGKPISVNYSYVFDGIWQEGDDIANSAQPTAKPGDVRVKDVNGDGKIDASDRAIIGSTQPSYIAGITNTFRYKGFYLSFLVRILQGTTSYNSLMNTYFDGRNAAMNRTWWTPENPINTYPQNRDDSNPFGVGYFGSSDNSSFVKISDVSFGYTFSKHLLKKAGLNNVEIYFDAKNLATFTKWKGMDPELSSQTGIPLSRTYLLGLRFGF
ncbi:TonB-dependent receptor [Arachidicoccus ginsenosidimutans]|uniref:TonB-dependent receptor n=1 Tax=Arachidicoccus sp. BS20 TaxID=1850526 RepID=UPI001E4ECF8A|nr:TonB-dependent receptor [Arachidicoccus sp. BS20]